MQSLKFILSILIFSISISAFGNQETTKLADYAFLTRTQAKGNVQTNEFGDIVLKDYPSPTPEQIQKLQCLPPPLLALVLYLDKKISVEKLESDIIKNMPERPPRGMPKPVAALDKILKKEKISLEMKAYSFNSIRQNLQSGLPTIVYAYVLLSDTNALNDYTQPVQNAKQPLNGKNK